MKRRFFRWFFKNRETDAITIAQAPNLSLWIVIVAGALIWAWHPPDRVGVILEIIPMVVPDDLERARGP
jgi:hypothetical protein